MQRKCVSRARASQLLLPISTYYELVLVDLAAGSACRSLARPRSGFFFLPRSLRGHKFLFFFTARSLHGGNHVLLLPRSSCAVLDFNSSAAQSLRGSQPHRSAPCRPYAADVLPRRSGHEICF
jgi:hypothetical protein